jgi:sugar lactone lactonase YvrE/antitoxin component YwqK of YwqJK toxin-antitoxin module
MAVLGLCVFKNIIFKFKLLIMKNFLILLLFIPLVSFGQEKCEGITVAGGNGEGSSADQLSSPNGIAFDDSGNLYIADRNNSRIQKWAPGASEGKTVAGDLQKFISGIALDDSGNLYIATANNHRIEKWVIGATEGTTVAGGNGYGSAADQLYLPNNIIIDNSGNLYIADSNNNRIQKWAPGATEGTTVAGGNGEGSSADQLNYPKGIAIDDSENLYIADSDNHRIQKWAPGATEGTTVAGGNGKGSSADQLNSPNGIAIDDSGNLYIATANNNRIQKWAPGATEGKIIAGGNGYGSAADQLSSPNGIAIDDSGNLYISDRNNNRIQKWALYGGFFYYNNSYVVLDKCLEILPLPLSQRDTDEDGVNDNLDQCPNTPRYDLNDRYLNPNGCSVKQLETMAFAHLIKNKINEFLFTAQPLTYDEILSRISVSESYGDYLYSFSHKNESSPYLYKMHYYPPFKRYGNKNGSDEDLIKEVYLNGSLIQEEVGNTIYKYDSSGNVEEKAYFKNGNLAELFNNDEIYELKLNNGRILKNRKTTETFFDKNGNVKLKYEFLQAVNYTFSEQCKCCPDFENPNSKSNRGKRAAIDFEWGNSDCAEMYEVSYRPVISEKTEIFYPNGLPKSKEFYFGLSSSNISYDGKKMSEDEDVKEPDGGGYLSINYDQNQEKSYKFSRNGAIDDLSEVYFVNAKSGLNVRDNNSLDGNKINGLPYGSLVYLQGKDFKKFKIQDLGKLSVYDTDPITGEKKQIDGNWVELVSMNYETSYNKNITSGYAFDGFLTKVKTDSFDYFKFLETENRVLYSELKEGEAYLYKGQKYTGLAISFHDNGQLAFAASYKDGKLNGWWRKWEENGSLFLETQYVDGEMVSEIDFN